MIIGDDKNQVHMEGYQVSNQCMALVRDGCLIPTKDVPELGYVLESTDKQYVPDVFYKVSTLLSISPYSIIFLLGISTTLVALRLIVNIYPIASYASSVKGGKGVA